MRERPTLMKLFLTRQHAISVFGDFVVSNAKPYRFFKKNLRYSVKELLEKAALAQVPVSKKIAEQLVTKLENSSLGDQTVIDTVALLSLYREVDQRLREYSELSFLSAKQLAFMLDCAPCSIYSEFFPKHIKVDIFQVSRWRSIDVLVWCEANAYEQKKKKEAN